MNKKISLIIVDDHDLFREGIKTLLGKSQKVEFIGEAANGKEFLNLLETNNPDVVLMDISMPVMDGIEATKQAVQLYPDIKILALSMFGEEEYYYKMIQSGVRGFILKSAGINEVEIAIQQVAEGSAYFSDELLEYVRKYIHYDKSKEKILDLTENEVKALQLTAKNLSDDEMAGNLNITTEELKKLKAKLYSKTGSNNSSGLVMYAIKNKIIEI